MALVSSLVVSYCEVVTFQLVSCVSCGAWLYRFLIFALFLTLFIVVHSMFGHCVVVQYTLSCSSFANILIGKRELVAFP